MSYSKCLALGVFLALVPLAAHADVITSISTPTNDFVDFSNLGPDGSTFSGSFGLTSNNGVAVTGSIGGNAGAVCDPYNSSCSYASGYGNYSIYSQGTHTLSFNFASGISAVGTTIDTDADINLGQFFGVTLSVYNGTTLLGTVNNSDLASANEGPVYIGAQDLSGANITSAVFTIDAVNLGAPLYEYRFQPISNGVDPNFCRTVTNFGTSNPQQISNDLQCPRTAIAHGVVFPVYSTTYFAFQDIYLSATTYPDATLSGAAADQTLYADSLNLLDAPVSSTPLSPVPEPGTLLLVTQGTGALAWVVTRRRRWARR